MPIIKLKEIHKSFGPEVVLDELNLSFYAGGKVGMVGVNGCGKTTILKLITRSISPDIGEVSIRKRLKIGYLAQEPVFDGDLSVTEQMHVGMEEVFSLQERLQNQAEHLEGLAGRELDPAMKEYDRLNHAFELAGGYEYEAKIKSLLTGVGLEKELYEQKTSCLSGGQLSRLGLAKVLLTEADVLLLDEPTNHLDLQAIEWLEKFLRNYHGAVVIISHDRYLLDRVAEKIVEVDGGKAKVWKGNYSNYMATKETVDLHEQRQRDKKISMIEKTRDFIARNKNREGMRKTARGRATRLRKMLAKDDGAVPKNSQRRRMSFAFAQSRSRSSIVIRCEALKMSFGALTLFENLNLDVLRGERLGITGPNGTGKSTLLKLVLGELEPTSGSITLGKNLRAGYLDQHGDELSPGNTVLDEARSVREDMTEEAVRAKLGAFGFTREDVFKDVDDISGGQRNRLMLCKLVLSEPDVLILDEPTNHLDILSKETLEEAIKDFNGAVVVVSHDRYFLNRVAEKLLVVGVDRLGGKAVGSFEFVPGPQAYSKYVSLIESRASEISQGDLSREKKRKRRQPKAASKTPEELRKFNKLSTEDLEEGIMEIEEHLAELQESFGDEKIYQNVDLFAGLKKEFDRKKEELDLLYRAYELREK